VTLYATGKDSRAKIYEGIRELPLWDPLEASSNLSKPIFMCGNFPLVDAADARNRCFSFTIQKAPKRLTVDNVTELRKMLHLKDSEMLYIVFVVPKVLFDSFRVSGNLKKHGHLVSFYKTSVDPLSQLVPPQALPTVVAS
jgi:hypothetical protein